MTGFHLGSVKIWTVVVSGAKIKQHFMVCHLSHILRRDVAKVFTRIRSEMLARHIDILIHVSVIGWLISKTCIVMWPKGNSLRPIKDDSYWVMRERVWLISERIGSTVRRGHSSKQVRRHPERVVASKAGRTRIGKVGISWWLWW